MTLSKAEYPMVFRNIGKAVASAGVAVFIRREPYGNAANKLFSATSKAGNRRMTKITTGVKTGSR